MPRSIVRVQNDKHIRRISKAFSGHKYGKAEYEPGTGFKLFSSVFTGNFCRNTLELSDSYELSLLICVSNNE